MKQRVPHTGLRITTILVSMVVSVVTIILCCCVFVFLDRYRSAMVQSARTSSEQAVSQVSSTVESYLRDMDQSMRLVRQFMLEEPERRDELLSAFLKFRPDVVAVTSYSPEGELLECWAPGREPKEEIFQNLSFDLQTARAAEEPYIMAPHVESIFEGYYPWVVTGDGPDPEGGEAAWVSLDLSFSGISSYINNVSIGQRGYCFLMDAGGNIVYHPQQQLLYSGLKSEKHGCSGRSGGRNLCRRYGDFLSRGGGGQWLAHCRCELCRRAGEPQCDGDAAPVVRAGNRGACRFPSDKLAALAPAGSAFARPCGGYGQL